MIALRKILYPEQPISQWGIIAGGIAMILLVGALDYLTGPKFSLVLFYVLPIGYAAWYGGRASGLWAAALTAVVWVLSGLLIRHGGMAFVEGWNTFTHVLVFTALALILSELRKVEAGRLKLVKDEYSRLVETVVEAILAVDSVGRITFASARASDMLGHPVSSLLNRTLSTLVSDEKSRSIIESLGADHAIGDDPVEVSFQHPDGSIIWTLVRLTRTIDETGLQDELVLLLTDVTELKESKEELQRRFEEITSFQQFSEELARSLDLSERVQKSLDTVLSITHFDAACIYFVNESRAQLELAAEKGFSPEFINYVRIRPLDHGVTGKVASTGEAIFLRDAMDEPLFDKNVREIEDIRAFISVPLFARDKGLGVLNVALHRPYDFSEPERLMMQTLGRQIGMAVHNAQLYEAAREREEEIRRLSLDLVKVQENERKRFARELHDGLSQVLTTLKISAELVAKNFRTDVAATEEHVSNVLLLTDEAQSEATQIAFDLRPSILDDFGLSAAISMRASRFEQVTGIRVELHLPASDVRFDSLVETTVYRIIQETLSNVAKHSGAKRVMIQLLMRDQVLAITVMDNGVGFDVKNWLKEGDTKPHYGLRNVKERVQFMEGMFRIESSPGRGTEFLIEIPLKHFMNSRSQHAQ